MSLDLVLERQQSFMLEIFEICAGYTAKPVDLFLCLQLKPHITAAATLS